MGELLPSLFFFLLLFPASFAVDAPICKWPPSVVPEANMRCHTHHGKRDVNNAWSILINFNRSEWLEVSLERKEIERRLNESDAATCCFDRSARRCEKMKCTIRPNWMDGYKETVSQHRCCEIFRSKNVNDFKDEGIRELAKIDLHSQQPTTTILQGTTKTPPTSDEGSLGWRSIAAIVAASLLLLILIVSLVAYCIKRRFDRLHALDIERRFSEGGAAYAGLREGPGGLT